MSKQATQDYSEPLDIVWGAEAIGRVINRSPRVTQYLLEAGKLPAKKTGRQWSASITKLREHFESA